MARPLVPLFALAAALSVSFAACTDDAAVPGCTAGSCGEAARCVAGECRPTACADQPCGEGRVCWQQTCVEDACVGVSCGEQICQAGACVAAACQDGVKGGEESDVDCGGGCAKCENGKACAAPADCASGECAGGLCTASGCGDGQKNGAETDVDCGGGCPGCAEGKACVSFKDCASGVCSGGTCSAPSCSDQVKNGSETDKDCGGNCPERCADGKGCRDAFDCRSGACSGGACVAATCEDKSRNGLETDVDCGGGSCPRCAEGRRCAGPSDCASGVCTAGFCQAATCSDGAKNSSETDVDCGGGCPLRCADGKGCAGPADCFSRVCDQGKCKAPGCSDKVENGTETDVDCGGACPKCAAGQSCGVPADCASGLCLAAETEKVCGACNPGQARCKQGSGTVLETCNLKGDGWSEAACSPLPGSTLPANCVGDRCQICLPSQSRCSADGKALETCSFDGTSWGSKPCASGKCDTSTGAPSCGPTICTPGASECVDSFSIRECLDGTGFVQKDCRAYDAHATADAKCAPTSDPVRKGACEDPCAQAARAGSHLGCEFFAAVTSNTELGATFKGSAADGQQPAQVSEFGLVIHNPNATSAKVSITRKVSGVEVAPPTSPGTNGQVTVAARGTLTVKLPWQVVSGTGLQPFAYRVKSSLPVAAYQHNPVSSYTGSAPQYDTNGACTNCANTTDASMLLPVHALGSEYVAVGQDHIGLTSAAGAFCFSDEDCPGEGNKCSAPLFGSCTYAPVYSLPAFMAIVAVEDDTLVTVRFSMKTLASKVGPAVGAQAKGSVGTFRLNRFDVLQFLTDADGNPVATAVPEGGSYAQVARYASDPTGSLVFASDANDPSKKKRVAVFSGADCTFKPFDKFACDHVEEMMLPFSAWGRRYVGPRSLPYRTSAGVAVTTPSPDYWRLVAGCGKRDCPDGTMVTITPAPTAAPAGVCTGGVCRLPPIDAPAGRSTAPWFEFTHSESFTVVADQPVMLAQYLTGQDANVSGTTKAAQGDPSLILMPPQEQWLTEASIAMPPTLTRDYVLIAVEGVAPMVQIDGVAATAGNFPGADSRDLAGGVKILRVPVSAAGHRIVSSNRFGVTAYGYESYVSTGYLGGLNLAPTTVFGLARE